MGATNHAHVRWRNLICQLFPSFSPFPQASLFLEIQQILKLGHLITLQWPLSVQVKGKVVSHFNQNLETIKFNEEGMLKTEIGQKVGAA